MIFNIIYLMLLFLFIYSKIKGYCNDCDPNEARMESLQILIVGLGVQKIIGSVAFFKVATLVLISFFIKQLFLRLIKLKTPPKAEERHCDCRTKL